MSDSDETVPAYSVPVNNRVIVVIDHGTVVTVVVTGIPKGDHPGRLYRRVTHKGNPGRALNMTREGAVALFRLLEQTEGVQEFLQDRRETEKLLFQRHLLLLLGEIDWGV